MTRDTVTPPTVETAWQEQKRQLWQQYVIEPYCRNAVEQHVIQSERTLNAWP